MISNKHLKEINLLFIKLIILISPVLYQNRNIGDSGAPAVTHGWVRTPVSAETPGEAEVNLSFF